MLHPILFLMGYSRLRADRRYAGELMNLFGQKGYVYRNLTFCGDHICLDCALWSESKIREACRERGIPIVRDRLGGLPSLVWRYRHRAGIFLGLLLFCGILFASGRVLWSIRVEGN